MLQALGFKPARVLLGFSPRIHLLLVTRLPAAFWRATSSFSLLLCFVLLPVPHLYFRSYFACTSIPLTAHTHYVIIVSMFGNTHLASTYSTAGRTFPLPTAPQMAQPLLAMPLGSPLVAPPFRAASCLSAPVHFIHSNSPLSYLFSSTYQCELKTDRPFNLQTDHSYPPLSHLFSSTYDCKLKTDHFLSPLTTLESTHTVSVYKHMSYNSFGINTCPDQPS